MFGWVSARPESNDLIEIRGCILREIDKRLLGAFANCFSDLAIKMIVRNGANINVSDDNGTTPLILACQEGRDECVDFLISEGAHVNACDQKGYTALHAASARGCIECIDLLVASGADVGWADERGVTALHRAAGNGRIGCAKRLVAVGADVNAASKDGFTAATLAVGALVRLGVDIDADERMSRVGWLIDAGADFERASFNGISALDMARQSGMMEIIFMWEHRQIKESLSLGRWERKDDSHSYGSGL